MLASLNRRIWIYAAAFLTSLALVYTILLYQPSHLSLDALRSRPRPTATPATPLANTPTDGLEDVLGPLREIISPTYHRTEGLPEYLDNYATGSIPSLKQIILIWNNEEPPPLSLNQSLSKYQTPITLERRVRNSKNERFRRTPSLTTACILALDDDMVISPRDVELAFQAWQGYRYPRKQMVGYVRRRVENGKYRMSPSPSGYSMVLTKSAFFHVDWMDLWWSSSQTMTAFREYVDSRKLPDKYPDLTTGCEDIAMAYLYAHHARTPPLWVSGAKFHDIGHSKLDGISTQPGHNDARQACVEHFENLFGKGTMVDTQMHMSLIQDEGAADWV